MRKSLKIGYAIYFIHVFQNLCSDKYIKDCYIYEDLHAELEYFIVFLRNIETTGIISNNSKEI